MTASRPGLRRADVVSTAVVVLLVVLGVWALWPRTAPTGTGPVSDPNATIEREAVVVPDAELAAARAAAGLPGCPGPSGAAAAGPLAGISAPCLGQAGTVDIGAALAGRPALVNVWASWCLPCRTELPVLAEYAARPDAVAVIGVVTRDDPRAALALLDELDVRLPVLADSEGTLREALDIPPALPISYLVAADGSVTRVDPPTPFTSSDQVAAAVVGIT